MPNDQAHIVAVQLAPNCKRTIRALEVIAETLNDVANDFEYRDDVKRAVRACNFLLRNLTLSADVK